MRYLLPLELLRAGDPFVYQGEGSRVVRRNGDWLGTFVVVWFQGFRVYLPARTMVQVDPEVYRRRAVSS